MQYQSLLNIIIELLRNSSGGSSSVDITGNSAGIATGANITTLQNTLNTTLGNLLTQLSAINGNTDLIETLQTNTNNLLTLTNSYVDGVEGLLTALGNNTDNLETLLATLGLNTDQIESLITAGNALLTTIRNQQTDGTQTTKIRDTAGQELNINPDGSLNVTGNITNGFVRKEQESYFNGGLDVNGDLVPFGYTVYKTYNNTGTLLSTSSIINDDVRTMPLEQKAALEKLFNVGIVETRVVNNSPAIGDKTTYICYNKHAINTYLGLGINIASNENSIKRIIEFANGDMSIRWARNKFDMSLVFDNGTQNYLNYTY